MADAGSRAPALSRRWSGSPTRNGKRCASAAGRVAMAEPVATPIPGDCRGLNFFHLDDGLRQLLPHYLDPALLAHLTPHFDRLGALAGGRLDELAAIADRNPPVLQARDRLGRDEDGIEYHPAYREMER